MTEIEQTNMGEVTRKYNEEKEARLIKEVTENNVMILKLQKQIMELQVVVEEKK